MKRLYIKPAIVLFIIICLISSCGRKTDEKEAESSTEKKIETVNEIKSENNTSDDLQKEDEDMDTYNRALIAESLGISEETRSLRFIINVINTIKAGKIQKAEKIEEDGEQRLDILAEDGTNYRLYLSSTGNVDAVENLTTGEWPIKSSR